MPSIWLYLLQRLRLRLAQLNHLHYQWHIYCLCQLQLSPIFFGGLYDNGDINLLNWNASRDSVMPGKKSRTYLSTFLQFHSPLLMFFWNSWNNNWLGVILGSPFHVLHSHYNGLLVRSYVVDHGRLSTYSWKLVLHSYDGTKFFPANYFISRWLNILISDDPSWKVA